VKGFAGIIIVLISPDIFAEYEVKAIFAVFGYDF